MYTKCMSSSRNQYTCTEISKADSLWQPVAHCKLVDFSTGICWISPVVILEVPGLFCHFNSLPVFEENVDVLS